MSTVARLRGLGALVSALLGCVAAGHAGAAGRLNLYCAYPDAAVCRGLANGFGSGHDVKVSVVQKPTGELLAQVRAEAGNQKADVWWGGPTDSFLLAAEEGLLEEYRSPKLGELHEWATRQTAPSGYKTVGVYGALLVLGYNTELLQKKKLAAPQCWRDLLKPEFKGEIQLSNPQSSGTAYMALATLVQTFGEEAAFAFLKSLHPSVSTYQRSGAGPLKAVARGEATVGLAVLHGVLTEAANGFPVGMAPPCEGASHEVGSMAIIKGARNLPNAKLFYDWALSKPAQELPASLKQYALPAARAAAVSPAIPDTSKVKVVSYDYVRFGSAAERKRLLGRWEREILGTQ